MAPIGRTSTTMGAMNLIDPRADIVDLTAALVDIESV